MEVWLRAISTSRLHTDISKDTYQTRWRQIRFSAASNRSYIFRSLCTQIGGADACLSLRLFIWLLTFLTACTTTAVMLTKAHDLENVQFVSGGICGANRSVCQGSQPRRSRLRSYKLKVETDFFMPGEKTLDRGGTPGCLEQEYSSGCARQGTRSRLFGVIHHRKSHGMRIQCG